MQKLINSVQNYAWGSKTALTDLYGIANPNNLPMAELWMGAHPKSSSKIEDASGQVRSLRDMIDADKDALQGHKVVIDFDRKRMTLVPATKRPKGEILVGAEARLGQLIVTKAEFEGQQIAAEVCVAVPNQ